MNDAQFSSAQARALILTKAIKRRDDVRVRTLVEGFDGALDYEGYGLEKLAISDKAWSCVQRLQVDPRRVFAHPDVLRQHPETSLYYRGIATLSLKRVSSLATSVDTWENPTQGKRRPPTIEVVCRVVRLYNAVISSIIEGTDAWTLENGYRNILATIGISQDGKMRNIIGREAENAVRDKLLQWIEEVGIPCEQKGEWFELGEAKTVRMAYGSDPDIVFEKYDEQTQDWALEVTIEIKGGMDPAGALERLGAIKKSFDQTPARVENIAILGVVTSAMRAELDQMKMVDFDLYDVVHSKEGWDRFAQELFHHKLRLLPWKS